MNTGKKKIKNKHKIRNYIKHYRDSLVAQTVQNQPAMQETQEMQICSLGWEDPLEEGMATHSGIVAWRILWTEEPGRLTAYRVAKS